MDKSSLAHFVNLFLALILTTFVAVILADGVTPPPPPPPPPPPHPHRRAPHVAPSYPSHHRLVSSF